MQKQKATGCACARGLDDPISDVDSAGSILPQAHAGIIILLILISGLNREQHRLRVSYERVRGAMRPQSIY
jgi:hypothetical protein